MDNMEPPGNHSDHIPSNDIFMSLLKPPSPPLSTRDRLEFQRDQSSPATAQAVAKEDPETKLQEDDAVKGTHPRDSLLDQYRTAEPAVHPPLPDSSHPVEQGSNSILPSSPANQSPMTVSQTTVLPSPIVHPSTPPIVALPVRTASPVPPQPGKALDVTDALTYLDLVKLQFESVPVVYNKFLDVMKDFKSAVIDTPGVIERVSQLFQGHPTLIQGFNTFLPPGYRIECSLDSNHIRVTTPSGVTTQSNPALPSTLPSKLIDPPTIVPIPTQEQQATGSAVGKSTLSVPDGLSSIGPFVPANSSSISSSGHASASTLGGGNRGSENGTKEPVQEFQHAMTYINRIKTRFADNQDVYKGFLQLLHSYQREQMTIQEAISQVSVLFKDATDLLDEFKLYLGDPSNSASGDLAAASSQGIGESWSAMHPDDPDVGPSRRKPDFSSASLKRKRRPADKEVVGLSKSVTGKPRKGKAMPPSGKADTSSPTLNHQRQAISPPRVAMSQSQIMTQYNAPSADESIVVFFEQLKRFLEERDAYDEFLKLLEMFSMEILDARQLLERLDPFLSDEQTEQFIEILGWDDEKHEDRGDGNEYGDSPLRRRAMMSLERTSYHERVLHLGPSYRNCPTAEIGLACSGRDELCRAVLNDDWESHPTWASEESGFVSHKKNLYEEALHRSEEERHEYQFHIEAMAKALSILEPLLKRIEDMDQDERALFRLPPDLGSPSPSIHQRIIKKVYGKEAGLEVIQSLHEFPAYAIPVVVLRLRQKDEEWRRGQREWNKIWREVDARNFYRSTDHQGITFKANDKKNSTVKAFVSQVETIREEIIGHIEGQAAGLDKYHLEYSFEDADVLMDAVKLCFCYLDRQTLIYAKHERRAIERFLRRFVSLLVTKGSFPLDTLLGNSVCDPAESDGEGDMDVEECCNSTGTPIPKLNRASNQELSSIQDVRTRSCRQSSSVTLPDEIWVRRATETVSRGNTPGRYGLENQCDPPASNGPGTLYMNTTFYVLVRLLQLLYSRLLLTKEISKNLTSDKSKPWLPNPVSVELGVNDTMWSGMNSPSSSGEEVQPSFTHFYHLLLTSVVKVIDGEQDQQAFEDHTRVIFGTQAYLLFTLDKVIGALNKQAHMAVSDGKGLLSLLQEQRANEFPSIRDQIQYRIKAQILANADENVYKVDLIQNNTKLRIRLLRREDPSMDIAEASQYEVYMESYLMKHPTEGLKRPPRLPYLKRNVRTAETADQESRSTSRCDLAVAIRKRNYRLKYEAKGEDVFVRIRGSGELEVSRQKYHQRQGVTKMLLK